MMQYRDFHYSDSDTFSPNNGNAATAPIKETEIDEEYETKLIEQLESGEISQTQYDTLTKKNALQFDKDLDEQGFIKGLVTHPYGTEEEDTIPQPEVSQEQAPQYQFDPSYWTDQLDEKDIDYLMLK